MLLVLCFLLSLIASCTNPIFLTEVVCSIGGVLFGPVLRVTGWIVMWDESGDEYCCVGWADGSAGH